MTAFFVYRNMQWLKVEKCVLYLFSKWMFIKCEHFQNTLSLLHTYICSYTMVGVHVAHERKSREFHTLNLKTIIKTNISATFPLKQRSDHSQELLHRAYLWSKLQCSLVTQHTDWMLEWRDMFLKSTDWLWYTHLSKNHAFKLIYFMWNSA